MNVLRRTVRLPFLAGYNRIRWDLSKLKDQHIELWIESTNRDPRCFSFSIYWNRLIDPRTWWWCKTNGAVKGVDTCFDFNLNLFASLFLELQENLHLLPLKNQQSLFLDRL